MDGMGLHVMALIAATLGASWLLDWAWRFWCRANQARRRAEAACVLREHGMEAHTYLPSFGSETGALRDVLAAFDFTNQIVLNESGGLVGRVLPKAQAQGPGLRLVVDNTK